MSLRQATRARLPRLLWSGCCGEGSTMSDPESLRCSSVRNRGGVQRVEGKLRASVERGDYYEAHQMYRTLFFR